MKSNVEHVRHICKVMKNISTGILWLVPISLMLIWTNFEAAKELGFFHRIAYPIDAPSTASLIGGFLISGTLALLVVAAVYHLRYFFALSSAGNMFSKEGAASLHKFSRYLLLYSVLVIPTETVLGVIMTINNPVGERIASVSFQTYDFTLIFLSLVLFAISWVIKEGVFIAEENAQFV